ncbi:glycine receptor subunit alpha-2-like [Convolutriloba macropyga]|uniref:glycine receptor subunit alpha-2-like n=1 Tax=Convolutriloba macropyga TaxID=536237 RepID=UPI003F51D7FE
MVIFNTEQKIIAAITLLILQLFTYSASSNGSETNLKYVKAENIGLVCKFDIVRMRTVSEVENTFTFDAILTRSWRDPRLRSFFGIGDIVYEKARYIEMKPEVLDRIWSPEIHFSPLVSVEESMEGSKVYLHENNEIETFMSGRYTFSCKMDLMFFPFDEQFCAISIIASMLDIKIQNPFSMIPNQTTANFIFEDLNFDTDYNLFISAVDDGYLVDWQHTVRIRMRRKREVFITTLFLPNLTLTILSWAVFWIGADKLPERISICIALILAQLILIVGAAEDFPNTSDFKLVDLYLIVNFFINSAALLETIVASIASRAPIKFKSRCKKDKNGNSDDEASVRSVQSAEVTSAIQSQILDLLEKQFTKNKNGEEKKNVIDDISKFLFPIIFVAWNTVFIKIAYDRSMKASTVGPLVPDYY